MYEVVVETSFTAAHRHDGSLHGHDFRVLLTVASTTLATDVVVDFHALKHAADRHLATLAYGALDQNPLLAGRGSTPTALARWLFETLAPEIATIEGAPDRRLTRVEVWDTPHSGGSFNR